MPVGRFLARTAAAMALAFLIASTVLYWLPLARQLGGWSTGSFSDYGYGDYYGSTSYSYSYSYDTYTTYTPAADALKQAAAEFERAALDEIAGELAEKTNTDLNKAKAFPDVCATYLIDCRGLSDDKIRPFIDAVLADRQMAISRDALGASQAANTISMGSLVLAIFAVVLGVLNVSRRRGVVSGVRST